MWCVTAWLLGSMAFGADPPAEAPPPIVASVLASDAARGPTLQRPQPFARRPSPRPELRLRRVPVGWSMPRASDSHVEAPSAPATRTPPRRRSRGLLLGAASAFTFSGVTLLAANVVRTNYLDESNRTPTRGAYRWNRVLGHAGYASAVASGALVLGAVRMEEW